MPEIVGDESVGVKYAINGLISLTPDGMPILGETPEVKGLWSAAAVWVKEGPGVGKSLGGVDGATASRTSTSTRRTSSRFHDHQKTRAHVKARTFEAFPKTYGIVHPAEQWASERGIRRSPMYEQRAGARRRVLRGGRAGSGRSGTRRTRRSWSATGSSRARPSGTRAGGRRSSTPSISRCASTPGSSISRRSRSSTSAAPGALDALQRERAGADGRRRSAGSSTRRCSSPGGGFKSDLTIMRLGDEEFRIVTGGAHGMADRKLFATRCPTTARRRSST